MHIHWASSCLGGEPIAHTWDCTDESGENHRWVTRGKLATTHL